VTKFTAYAKMSS